MSQGPLRVPVHTTSNNSKRLLHIENGCSASNANCKTSNTNDMLQSEQANRILNKSNNFHGSRQNRVDRYFGLNLSDHFPIMCTFNLGDSLIRLNLSNTSTNIAWNKALSNGSLTDYAFAVSQNICTVDTNQTDIEKYYSEIINGLVLAAKDTLPIVKHRDIGNHIGMII
ncbi:unnamed protein product [Mytilus coruscus]|uniref:Endonuclease/exonuclease/phosphatase domain-containing protein n=1 Tax=Mytilus coruscus TaxID=42192 RepID=A0A6J8D0F7_MYTCO|nr:unnamed protein product [Mytilus coruscus]